MSWYWDARFGARLLAKRPLLTAIALLSLALGIGANTAIFTVVHHLLLSPLPFEHAERVVSLYTGFPGAELPRNRLSEPEIADLRARARTLEAISAYAAINANVSLDGGPTERIVTVVADTNTFSTLGVHPVLGRDFVPDEGILGGQYVVILSYDLWQSRYGGDPNVLGKNLILDTEPHEIVGVAPQDFAFPYQSDARIFAPLALDEAHGRGNHYLHAIGRMRADLDVEDVQTELDRLAGQLRREHPSDYPDYVAFGIEAAPLREDILGSARDTLIVLFGAVALLLLIACANVASLLLASGMARARELALRMALGAERGRILRQLLIESAVLGLIGAGGGLLTALWGVDALIAVSPAGVPSFGQLGVSWTALAFAVGLSLLTGLLIGALPAIHASRVSLQLVINDGGERATESRRSRRLRSTLVGAEIAVALMLTVGAMLLSRSLGNMRDADLGFRSDNLLTMRLTLSSPKYPRFYDKLRFYERLFWRLDRSPGLPPVGAVSHVPLGGEGVSRTFELEGCPGEAPPDADLRIVNAHYFDVMEVPLLAGRTFDELEHRGDVNTIIIDETLAARYWRDGSPIGKRLRLSHKEGWLTIVGVVGHVRHEGIDSLERPQLYLPYSTRPSYPMTLVMRAPRNAATAVQREVSAVDPNLPLYDIRTMNERISDSLALQRFATLLFELFALLALLLAGIGVYAVTSYWVAQREREMAIRLALGAKPRQVVAMIVKQGFGLAVIGVLIGAIGALALSRSLVGLLYGVSATDPAIYGIAGAVVIGAALVATYSAARRATRIDPMLALGR